MLKRIRCLKCGGVAKHDPQRVSGCLCDPDSPSWIAIEPDGRMLKMSHADYVIEQRYEH